MSATVFIIDALLLTGLPSNCRDIFAHFRKIRFLC